jgi:hypothetical protein
VLAYLLLFASSFSGIKLILYTMLIL